MVSDPFPPQMTSSPGVPLIVSDRFVPVIVHVAGPSPIAVVAVAVVFVVTGSVVAEDTLAVFAMTVPLAVPAFTFTTSVNVASAEATTVGLLQLTEPVPPTPGIEQVHPAAEEMETKVVLAGIVSVSTTVVAVSGPSLRTLIVYVMFPFATAGSGESAFRIRRLAPVDVVVVVAVIMLFADTGSSAEVTVAVFEMTVPFAVAAFTFTVSVKVALPLAGRVAIEQFTVPVPPTAGVVQLQPAGEDRDTNVVLDGNVSDRATVIASAAVRFVTPIV